MSRGWERVPNDAAMTNTELLLRTLPLFQSEDFPGSISSFAERCAPNFMGRRRPLPPRSNRIANRKS